MTERLYEGPNGANYSTRPPAHYNVTEGQGGNSRLNTAAGEGPANYAAPSRPAAVPDHYDLYEERALAREADQRELEDWRAEQKAERESQKRAASHRRWMDSDPDINVSSDPVKDVAAARELLNEFRQRAEGEELAAKIVRRRYRRY